VTFNNPIFTGGQKMALGTFLAINLPYCILRLPDGSYIVLNREYKPLGFNTDAWVTYADYPIGARYRKIHPNTARKLNVSQNFDPDCIYLYNDGCNPLSDIRFMQSYGEKLAILAKMKVMDYTY
jgi:hypothetical protein